MSFRKASEGVTASGYSDSTSEINETCDGDLEYIDGVIMSCERSSIVVSIVQVSDGQSAAPLACSAVYHKLVAVWEDLLNPRSCHLIRRFGQPDSWD